MSAVQYTNSVSSLQKSKTLLSIAKLSSCFAECDEDPRRLLHEAEGEEKEGPSHSRLQAIRDEMQRQLAVIEVTEQLRAFFPSKFDRSNNGKVHVMDLIEIIIQVLEGSEGEEDSNLSLEALLECFGKAVSLFRMRLEQLQDAEQQRSSLSAEDLLIMRAMGVRLWVSTVQPQLVVWMQLCAYMEEHSALVEVEHELHKTFLYSAIRVVMNEVMLGTLPSQMLLSLENRSTAKTTIAAVEEVLPVTVDDVLRSLDFAELSYGSSALLQRRQQILSRLLRQCVDLALRPIRD